jgi:hypothetical protein
MEAVEDLNTNEITKTELKNMVEQMRAIFGNSHHDHLYTKAVEDLHPNGIPYDEIADFTKVSRALFSRWRRGFLVGYATSAQIRSALNSLLFPPSPRYIFGTKQVPHDIDVLVFSGMDDV